MDKAESNAVDWAEKGQSLVKHGKITQARAALKKAEYWFGRMKQLEEKLSKM